MGRYLLIDLGSTYTKLVAVDSNLEDIIATATSFTTVATDISIGYKKALSELEKKLCGPIQFDQILACSSAAGGLKMAAIGLVEELTVEGAKQACLGAGAKVDLVFANHLNKHEIAQIIDDKIDIVLLAGGTDGGNSECVIYNATVLGQAKINKPIIYAGNKAAIDEIEDIFTKYHMDGYICSNIMPEINVLKVDAAKKKIREIFLKNIIVAKGIKKIENVIDKVVLPTPEAVLKACTLLSKGYLDEEGFGQLMTLDIGGATTDVYSFCPAVSNRNDIVLKGLEQPYAMRTVEGDLGMRYSATGVYKSLSEEEIHQINYEYGIDINDELDKRHQSVEDVYTKGKDAEIDTLIGGICVDKASTRHSGRLEEVYSPVGRIYYQIGKDLSKIGIVIGTGGILVNNMTPRTILEKVKARIKDPLLLKPIKPDYFLDKDYILSAMGLLSDIDPLLSLKIMKKHIVKLD